MSTGENNEHDLLCQNVFNSCAYMSSKLSAIELLYVGKGLVRKTVYAFCKNALLDKKSFLADLSSMCSM